MAEQVTVSQAKRRVVEATERASPTRALLRGIDRATRATEKAPWAGIAVAAGVGLVLGVSPVARRLAGRAAWRVIKLAPILTSQLLSDGSRRRAGRNREEAAKQPFAQSPTSSTQSSSG